MTFFLSSDEPIDLARARTSHEGAGVRPHGSAAPPPTMDVAASLALWLADVALEVAQAPMPAEVDLATAPEPAE